MSIVLMHDYWCREANQILLDLFMADPFKDCVHDVECLVTSLDKRYTASMLDELPNLRLIASCTTGLDHIELDYCKQRGIEVLSLQGETEFLSDIWATAEHTWALIMALVRRVPAAHKNTIGHELDGSFGSNWDREAFQGTELHGKTLGIVGYGRVGQQIADFARAFGMKVIAYEPTDSKWRDETDPPFMKHMVEFCALETLLLSSDIITVHVPLNEETKGMFYYPEFETIRFGTYFVNTSRGAVVNNDALLYSLNLGRLRGAALDVIDGEHEFGDYRNGTRALINYARTHDNLVITPHIAGNTEESRRKTQIFMAEKIRKWMEANAHVCKEPIPAH